MGERRLRHSSGCPFYFVWGGDPSMQSAYTSVRVPGSMLQPYLSSDGLYWGRKNTHRRRPTVNVPLVAGVVHSYSPLRVAENRIFTARAVGIVRWRITVARDYTPVKPGFVEQVSDLPRGRVVIHGDSERLHFPGKNASRFLCVPRGTGRGFGGSAFSAGIPL